MSELITSDYYYGLEAEQYTFFRIPKILFSPTYKTLSVSAKMLYALMLDRMSLSARNRWMDEDGRVFIYFRMSEIMSALGCGHNKAIALYAELEKVGLIERKKQGMGRPAKIYVKNFIPKTGSQRPKRKYPQRLLVSMMTSPQRSVIIRTTRIILTSVILIHPSIQNNWKSRSRRSNRSR